MTNDLNNPTEKKEDVIADYADELKQIEMEGYEPAVKKARNALFWASGLIFAAEMIGMFRAGAGFDPYIFIFAIIEAGIFLALALWTKKKPYTALVLGLVAFVGFILLSIVVNGLVEGSTGVFKAMISGIIVKIFILVALIGGLSDAKALQRARENR